MNVRYEEWAAQPARACFSEDDVAATEGVFLRPIEDFCCQSAGCPDRGKRGAGNLSFRGRGGRKKHIRMIFCRSCVRVFSERAGTPISGVHLPKDKALAVLQHIREGCGTRATARLVGVHRDTVTRLARQAGRHAESLHDELVALSPPDDRGPV